MSTDETDRDHEKYYARREKELRAETTKLQPQFKRLADLMNLNLTPENEQRRKQAGHSPR